MTAGLRERKKQQTRELISATATRLFIDRGFEQTTIADVAAAAEVAKMTVTNYFPLKEDLVFDRADEIAGALGAAVTGRGAGTSALAAIRDRHLAQIAEHDPTLGFRGLAFGRLVAASPALLARERAMHDAQEDHLAEVLQAEFGSSPADVGPRVAAAQLAGLVRVLYYEGRRRLMAGEEGDTIALAITEAATAGYAALEPTLPAAMVQPA